MKSINKKINNFWLALGLAAGLLFVFQANKAFSTEPYRHSSMFRNLEWKMAAENYMYFDESGNKVLLTEKFYGLMNHWFSPEIHFSAEIFLGLQQGASQYVHVGRKTREAGGVNLESFFVSWNTIEPLYLKAGALNQRVLQAPLLVSEQPFLGLSQEYILKNNYVLQYVDEVRFVLQQSIPSSSSELDMFTQVKDVASFMTASAFTSSFIPFMEDYVEAKGHITAYRFNNLSAEVADYGRKKGNQVKRNQHGIRPEFPHPYYGFHLQTDARYNVFPELGVMLEYSLLWNIGAYFPPETATPKQPLVFGEVKGQAAETYKIADSLTLGIIMPVYKGVILNPSVEYFRVGGNSALAYYMDDRYVSASRNGFLLGTQVNFKKYNLFLKLLFGFTQPQDKGTGNSGDNANYIKFEMGTYYEKT